MNFDEKYNKILSKIDSLINEDYNPKNIKNILNRIKLKIKLKKEIKKKRMY